MIFICRRAFSDCVTAATVKSFKPLTVLLVRTRLAGTSSPRRVSREQGRDAHDRMPHAQRYVFGSLADGVPDSRARPLSGSGAITLRSRPARLARLRLTSRPSDRPLGGGGALSPDRAQRHQGKQVQKLRASATRHLGSIRRVEPRRDQCR